MKSRMKFEIALAAGMSKNTMGRWFQDHQQALSRLGVRPAQRLLPPKAVRYVCDELGLHEEDF